MGIKLLEPSLVQRIAAGEVIERPSSVLRELLDNSLDAGAGRISVWIEGGGIERLTVSDDGAGMSEEDLGKSCQPHATSKISTLDDLFKIRTMGFRGEALYSIAACSRISISSNGKKKTVDNTEAGEVENDFSIPKGTRVVVENIFGAIPARRLFLKRPSAEAASCKNIFLEKALAFPDVEFKFFQDGRLKLDLPKAEKRRRIFDALASSSAFIASDTEVFRSEGDSFSLYGVGTTGDSFRSDRSQIRIFVNKHAVEDPALVAAVVNGYSEQFPGGRFPYFCLFVTITPELVDFNIHPAKRECRIRVKSLVASQTTTMIRGGLRKKIRLVDVVSEDGPFYASQAPNGGGSKPGGIFAAGGWPGKADGGFAAGDWPGKAGGPTAGGWPGKAGGGSGSRMGSLTGALPGREAQKFDPSWFDRARETVEGPGQDKLFEEPEDRGYRYIGQAFRLFLVAEKGDKLIFVDQHAAHERLLYDEFRKNKQVQRLLMPFKFPVERDVDSFLLENSHIYGEWGIELTRPEDLLWEINALPAISKGAEETVARFITECAGDVGKIEKNLFSTLACKAAIKAGDEVDRLTALALLDRVFLLEKPCCPHGRTFVCEVGETSLREAVGRFG